jgi:hypothetical protein
MTAIREGLPPLPERMQGLPLDERGYPIPWFVATMEDGKRDFRVADGRKLQLSLFDRRCWVCGEKMGQFVTFVIGPMCAVNRTTAEPGCHRECAIFSAIACPFLTLPKAKRNTSGIPDDLPCSPGPPEHAIQRNPGVTCLWTCRDWVYRNYGTGSLYHLGAPTDVDWYTQKRAATRAEILASIDSGMPILAKCAEEEGPDALAALALAYDRMLRHLPEAA